MTYNHGFECALKIGQNKKLEMLDFQGFCGGREQLSSNSVVLTINLLHCIIVIVKQYQKDGDIHNMKRIYMFGRIVRLSFLIAFAFASYAFVDMYIQSGFKFANLLLLFFIAVVVVFGTAWLYSMGLFFDKKNDIVKIVTGFSKNNRRERVLSAIESIDVELNGNIGMTFIIKYNHNSTEKIEYKFYRISFVEKSQYKRIKKQLNQINHL